jgi:hypothetical protein
MTPHDAKTEECKRVLGLLYQAATSSDMTALNQVLDETTRFHEPDCLPYGGSYSGHASLLALFAQVAGYLDFSTIKLDYIIADGENAVTSLRIKTRTRRTELRILEQAVVRDGKIVDLRIFPFDPMQIVADKQ